MITYETISMDYLLRAYLLVLGGLSILNSMLLAYIWGKIKEWKDENKKHNII